MSERAAVTTHLDAATLALADAAARARGETLDTFAAHAIRHCAESDAAFQAFVQVGIDAADRGELVPHEEVFRRIAGKRKTRSAA